MKKLLFFLLITCFTLQAEAVKKQNLRVLYVGGASDLTYGYEDSVAVSTSAKARTAAFGKFLRQYFTKVTVVDAKQYDYKMSYDYDVTVMDGTPKPLTPRSYEYDETGKIVGVIDATYFPDNFDCAVVGIGSASETIGRGIGTKNDWYCLCLDADAHSWNADHAIFKGPFKVKMTVKEKPTPEDAKHYSYYQDYPLPETLPMWRVQTKGYIEDPKFAVGMVSRPWGYTDSPDCESISSGVCAKTIDAVAIGRHGNFFHWGFAASPIYMTEEAKPVFANAVAYIAKFKGTHIIARKYDERTATREYLKELKELATCKSWLERLESDKEWEKMMLAEQAEAKAKQARGEKLSRNDLIAIDFTPSPPMTYSAYLARYQKGLYDVFGEEEQAYIDYYNSNAPYICGDKSYDIYIDNDAKAWRIANNDIRLIEKAIATLEAEESGKDVEIGDADRARRILTHYTLCRYQKTSDWRNWFDTYRDKMFFTESGGWKWLINTQDLNVPGNDYSILAKEKTARKKQPTAPAAKQQELSTDHNNPVAIAASFDKSKKLLKLKVKIHPGYHIYNVVSEKDPFIATTITFDTPDGVKIESPILPKSTALGSNGTTVFEDDCEFLYPVEGTSSGTIGIKISYQCCDSNICFPPVEKEITVEL